MLVYRGEATDMASMTPEEGEAVLDKWQAWIGKIGDVLKDVGAPFGESTSLVDDGSTAAASASSATRSSKPTISIMPGNSPAGTLIFLRVRTITRSTFLP